MAATRPYDNVFSTKDFIKRYKEVDVRVRKSFDEKIRIFAKNPDEWGLNNHPLRNEWQGYRSIDITNDYRAIYKALEEGREINAYFIDIGTHDELYG